MPHPLFLYSTNTWLAFVISERYYRQKHWVWCSPFFRPAEGVASAGMPPSAIPGEIYDRLFQDVAKGDRHSAWIDKNKAGLIKGANSKESEKVITSEKKAEIIFVVNSAQIADFKPLLYVMPFQRVKHLVREVPPKDRAHPVSVEYIIERLPRSSFDILELRR